MRIHVTTNGGLRQDNDFGTFLGSLANEPSQQLTIVVDLAHACTALNCGDFDLGLDFCFLQNLATNFFSLQEFNKKKITINMYFILNLTPSPKGPRPLGTKRFEYQPGLFLENRVDG